MIYTTNELPEPFLEWIFYQLKSYIYCNVDVSKLEAFSDVVNNKQLYRNRYNVEDDFDIKDAILISLNDFRFRRVNEGYIFYLNTDLPFPTHIAEVEEVCQLLNYGSLDVQPYPIFSRAFKYINTNLTELYNQYCTVRRYGGF